MAEDLPAYENKDGADLPDEDKALPEADQTPALDFVDTDDADFAEGSEEV